MAETRGPTTRRDALTVCALGLLVAAGGVAAALLSRRTDPPEEPGTEVAAAVTAVELGRAPNASEDVPPGPDGRTDRVADPVAPEEDVPGRFALPANAVGRLAERPEDRPAMQVWLVEESADDPSGVVVTGPVGVEVHEASKGRVSVPRVGRVLRWWLHRGDAWLRGDEAAERPDGVPSPFANVGWGPHGLLRLLDDRGRPAEGVEVTLHFSDLRHRRDLARVRTDADGLALFRLPDDKPSRLVPTPPSADATVYRVELPVVPPLTAPYSREGPWPAVIRLPPLGAVEVTLRASDEEKPAGQVWLKALVEGSQATGWVPDVVARIDDGKARFPRVGTGLRFSARCSPRPDDATPPEDDAGSGVSARHPRKPRERLTTLAEFEGPAAAGRSVAVSLPFGAHRPVFTGRLLLAAGGPAHSRVVEVSVPLAGAASRWRDSTSAIASTDAEGRFEAQLDADLSAIDHVELTVTSGNRELLRRRIGRVAPGAEVDLGDLRLDGGPAEEPLLVAGRVVDEGGGPVSNVGVWAWRRRGETWAPLRGSIASVGADGSFEIRRPRGAGDSWAVRLTSSPPGMTAEPAPFVPGEREVALRVRRTESLEVRVLLPAGLADGQGPWIVLQGEMVDTLERRDAVAGGGVVGGMYGAGFHVFSQLLPGTGRVVAYPPGLPDRVLAAKDVTIAPGVRADAVTFDLRTAFPVRIVTVVGPDGRPAGDGAVWWRSAEATEWNQWNSVTCRPDGTARVPGMTGIELLARSLGGGFAHAADVTSDVTLRVPLAQKPSVVEIVLADGLEAPPEPFRLKAGLFRADGAASTAPYPSPGDPRHPGSCRPDLSPSSRRARADVAEPGRYVVRVSLLLQSPDGSASGHLLPLESEAATDVTRDGSPRTIVLRWKPETLAAAMARIRED